MSSVEAITDDRLQAAIYVIGVLDGASRADIDRRRRLEPELDAEIGSWERRLAPLILTIPPVEPPAGLWDRIEAALNQSEHDLRSTETFAADMAQWESVGTGLLRKVLKWNAVGEPEALLLHMAPGAVVDRHYHAQREECMVLNGDMIVGDLSLYTGDLHLAQEGDFHHPITTRTGAVLYVRYQ